ncbi:DNA-binding protein D-ETS-4-like isoform X3 [Tigriopus californicus]|uniref:DNA-binding protein D-ETS-4-like isoform X3 n=1 Tax=Tigriopus californicus TaxID=6832 RepID=UPI0027D9EA55|nr:DNA-binding protein D-ETS-4-like isoform X3 [Tigriopus californicus]
MDFRQRVMSAIRHMMHLAPTCASPQLQTSSNFDFDLDLLPADGEVPDLGLLPEFANLGNTSGSLSLEEYQQNCGSFQHLDYQVPSPTHTLSPLETLVHSPTMFSPYDNTQKSPGAKPTTKPHPHGDPGQRCVQMPSPMSLPPASPYSPATRPNRLSSTDSCMTSSSTASIMQDSLVEFQELRNKIKQERQDGYPHPPPPPYNIATRGTLNIKIEPCDQVGGVATASVPQVPQGHVDHGRMIEGSSTFASPQRFNFKPMESGMFGTSRSDVSSYCMNTNVDGHKPLISMAGQSGCMSVSSSQADSEDVRSKIEPVLSLAMAEVKDDIENKCRCLGISHDPNEWSPLEVRKWLMHTVHQNNIHINHDAEANKALEYWANMEGKHFSQIGEEEFKERLPQGHLVYDQLDLWKSNAHFLGQQGSVVSTACSSATTSASGSLLNSSEIKKEDDSLDFSYVLQMLENKDESSSTMGYSQASCPVTHPLSPPPPYPSTSSFDSPQASASSGCGISTQEPRSNETSTDYGSEHYDDDDNEDDTEMEAIGSGSGSTSTGSPVTTNPSVSGSGRVATNIHLWQFVKELLNQPQLYSGCIHWIDREKGIFKIVDSTRVAKLWGKRKNRPAMNYDKLSRSLRQYYKKGIMKKTERTQRLVYQFCTPYHL